MKDDHEGTVVNALQAIAEKSRYLPSSDFINRLPPEIRNEAGAVSSFYEYRTRMDVLLAEYALGEVSKSEFRTSLEGILVGIRGDESLTPRNQERLRMEATDIVDASAAVDGVFRDRALRNGFEDEGWEIKVVRPSDKSEYRRAK